MGFTNQIYSLYLDFEANPGSVAKCISRYSFIINEAEVQKHEAVVVVRHKQVSSNSTKQVSAVHKRAGGLTQKVLHKGESKNVHVARVKPVIQNGVEGVGSVNTRYQSQCLASNECEISP